MGLEKFVDDVLCMLHNFKLRLEIVVFKSAVDEFFRYTVLSLAWSVYKSPEIYIFVCPIVPDPASGNE